MRACRALFPPQDPTATAQTFEINRGRIEERILTTFEVSATGIRFPFVEQAARLTRSIQSPGAPAKDPEVEFLITSRPAAEMSAAQILQCDRAYWGIENGLHQRLDVTAGEDRSRVRGNGALNLAVIRRAVMSVAIRWISHCKNKRRATTSGFFDSMLAQNHKKALKLVTTCKPSWLDDS